eukprot:Rhum_TRINITY_DN14135_c12_g1::Rhum_TRINITY_DN14135_c12_g1_i1::g.70491::m.70491
MSSQWAPRSRGDYGKGGKHGGGKGGGKPDFGKGAKSKGSKPGGNHSGAPHKPPAPQRQSDYLVPMLPFRQKVRAVQEHKARNPHRKFFSDMMTAVAADWVAQSSGTLLDTLQRPVPVEVGTDSATPVADASAAPRDVACEDGQTVINVRLFLATGIHPTQTAGDGAAKAGKHVMRRINLYAAKNTTEVRHTMLYGGPTSVDLSDYEQSTDTYLIGELCRLVKAQAGLDLTVCAEWVRLCTISYDEGPKTVVFWPNLSALTIDIPLELHGLVRHEVAADGAPAAAAPAPAAAEPAPAASEEATDKEAEPAAASEEASASATADATAAAPVAPPTTEIKVMQPTMTALASVYELQLGASSHHDTVEMCTAADVYDEWLRSDCAEKIADDLAAKAAEKEAKAANEEAENDRKRKRSEVVEECKRRRLDKEYALRSVWAADDLEQTDDERKNCEEQRAADLRALDAEEKRELAERMAELGGKAKTATVRDTKVYDRFQFLDRTKGFTTTTSVLSREWLAQQLLCLNRDLTFGESLHLVTLSSAYPQSSSLNYAQFSERAVAPSGPDAPAVAAASDDAAAVCSAPEPSRET